MYPDGSKDILLPYSGIGRTGPGLWEEGHAVVCSSQTDLSQYTITSVNLIATFNIEEFLVDI